MILLILVITATRGGKHLSYQSREKIRETNRAKNLGSKNPMFGRHHNEEIRKKLSELAKLKIGEKNPNYGNRGSKNPMFGKHHSEETNKKIAAALSKKVYCPELDVVFSSITEAAIYIGLSNHSSISNCLAGTQKTAGKTLINGKITKLHWEK